MCGHLCVCYEWVCDYACMPGLSSPATPPIVPAACGSLGAAGFLRVGPHSLPRAVVFSGA